MFDIHLRCHKSSGKECGSELEHSYAEQVSDDFGHCGTSHVLLAVVGEFNNRNKRATVQREILKMLRILRNAHRTRITREQFDFVARHCLRAMRSNAPPTSAVHARCTARRAVVPFSPAQSATGTVVVRRSLACTRHRGPLGFGVHP